MGYLVDVPVEGGGRLLVEAAEGLSGDELGLASPTRPGEVVARARESLEQSLDQLVPGLRAVADRLAGLGPQEVSVKFGLKLSAEAGIVVAKGSSEIHFEVAMTWTPPATPAVTK